MNELLSTGSGVFITENGSSTVIPSYPELPDEPGVRLKPCHIIVTLKAIYYDGDNIGSNWKFNITINSEVWNSGPRVLQWKSWNILNEKIYDHVQEHGCGAIQILFFLVRAWTCKFLFQRYRGARSDIIALPCLEEITQRRMLMLVTVIGWFNKNAVLIFVFDVSTQCI